MSLFAKIKSCIDEKNTLLPRRDDANEILVYSPLMGEIVPTYNLEDSVFREEILGRTFAIKPSLGKLYAPVNGRISCIYTTLHALCITSEDGLQILIHVGQDTVNLNGKYFSAKVKENDYVRAGQLLLEFDINSITKEGYNTTTCLVIIDPDVYKSIQLEHEDNISPKEKFLKVYEHLS